MYYSILYCAIAMRQPKSIRQSLSLHAVVLEVADLPALIHLWREEGDDAAKLPEQRLPDSLLDAVVVGEVNLVDAGDVLVAGAEVVLGKGVRDVDVLLHVQEGEHLRGAEQINCQTLARCTYSVVHRAIEIRGQYKKRAILLFPGPFLP